MINWLSHWLYIPCTPDKDASFISIQQYTAGPAEKADFNVWYILISCFPSSSSSHYSSDGKRVWLPDRGVSTASAHFSVWLCEVKYAPLHSQCQLSFVPLSTQCKDQCQTMPQCCIDKGQWKPNAVKMDIMQVPGGLSADLYVDRCTSLLCRSVVLVPFTGIFCHHK